MSPLERASRLKVGSCILGEQAATTRPVSFFSAIACRIWAWPGSEHIYLYSTECATPGMTWLLPPPP